MTKLPPRATCNGHFSRVLCLLARGIHIQAPGRVGGLPLAPAQLWLAPRAVADDPAPRRSRILIVVLIVILLFLGATARLFVWSPIDAPARVDAVVALGGDPGQRRAHHAVALAEAGLAPMAVISLGGNPPVTCPTGSAIQVVCFRADPLDTRGEAEYVAALAAQRHWTRSWLFPSGARRPVPACSSSGAPRSPYGGRP